MTRPAIRQHLRRHFSPAPRVRYPHGVDARRVAIHESAHATIARKLGLSGCGHATIVPDRNWLGHAILPSDRGAASVCAIMAGAAGEITMLGDHAPEGIEFDAELVRAEMARCGYRDADALWSYTLDLVQRNVDVIRWLATQLVRHRTLSGDFLDAIVRCG
jgi:hypothetical protein